jgi:tripartite-type tricarboxylate transporter receptor subunit TctC
MQLRRARVRALVLGVVWLATAIQLAVAQSAGAWPERAIRIVLPFPPGGPSDIVARLAADKMQSALKQPIVVENKPGAGGNIGSAEVARAAPDGYTWLFSPDSLVTVNPHVYKQMPFKVEDLMPVTTATRFNQTLVCNPALGVKSVAELVAKARSTPLSYASGGVGVPGHLSMELLQSMAGFQMNHVPYKGPAPATQDVLGNQVSCGLLAGPTVLPYVRAGKLIALGVSGSSRSPTLPEVPTLAEAGVPGYQADFSLVVFAPRGVPEPIIARFRQAFVEALRAPGVTEKLKAGDQTVVGSSPADAAATLAVDSQKWGALVRRIHLALD